MKLEIPNSYNFLFYNFKEILGCLLNFFVESDLVYWIFWIVQLFLSNFLPVKMSNRTKKSFHHTRGRSSKREAALNMGGQDVSPGLRNKQPVLLLL